VFASYCDTWSLYRGASDVVHELGAMCDRCDDEGTVIGREERPEFAQIIRLRAVLDKLERKLGLSPADRASFIALDRPKSEQGEEAELRKKLFGGA
jgi:phage terminase small subunit